MKTLKEARDFVVEGRVGGVTCPCCDQFAKLYKRKLNSTMAYGVIWLARRSQLSEWVDVPKTGPRILVATNQLGTVSLWGLVEQKAHTDQTKKYSGLWRTTPKGRDFAMRRSRVPSHVFLYNNRIRGWSETTTGRRRGSRKEVQLRGADGVRRRPEGEFGRMRMADRQSRVARANLLLETIASCGRGFFGRTIEGQRRLAHLEVDRRGRVWFVDDWTGRRIYTHYRGAWRGFSHGGTLKQLVEAIRDWIVSGRPIPGWYSDGDPWAYGHEAMERIRRRARELEIVLEDAADEGPQSVVEGRKAEADPENGSSGVTGGL